jgi:hypothetical protein
MLNDIQAELDRIAALEIEVAYDDEFEPEVGTLLRIQKGDSYWHILPEHFLELLKQLPDGAGSDEIHRAIETQVVSVWHGPAPPNSRDTVL